MLLRHGAERDVAAGEEVRVADHEHCRVAGDELVHVEVGVDDAVVRLAHRGLARPLAVADEDTYRAAPRARPSKLRAASLQSSETSQEQGTSESEMSDALTVAAASDLDADLHPHRGLEHDDCAAASLSLLSFRRRKGRSGCTLLPARKWSAPHTRMPEVALPRVPLKWLHGLAPPCSAPEASHGQTHASCTMTCSTASTASTAVEAQ